MNFLRQISTGIETVVSFFGRAGAWLAIPMMVVILFDVIGRRFFNTGSTALQDLEWHFHGALFLLAFGWAYIRDEHVRIEILRERWRPRTHAVIEILGVVFFLLPYCFVVIWFGIDFVERAYLRNEGAPGGMGLSHRWIIKSFLVIAFILFALAGINRIIRAIDALCTRHGDGSRECRGR